MTFSNTPLTKVFTLLLLITAHHACPWLQSTPEMTYNGWGVSYSYTDDGVSTITRIDISKHDATGSIYSLQAATANGLLGNQVPNPTPFSVSVTPL